MGSLGWADFWEAIIEGILGRQLKTLGEGLLESGRALRRG